MDGDNMLYLMIMIALGMIVLFIVIKIILSFQTEKTSSPYLIETTKMATRPKSIPAYKIKPSFDRKYGIEFTYALWVFIDGTSFEQNNDWKHVFHKGNPSGTPLQAPGMWIYPNENKMAIIMNSFNQVKNTCNIGNIPVNKWFHVVVSCIGNAMDVYVNGQLKKRCELDGIPKQNYGDLYINKFGGFNGFLSRFRYYNYALPFYQIEQAYKEGPSKAECTETGTKPPYLAPNWWMNSGFPDAQF